MMPKSKPIQVPSTPYWRISSRNNHAMRLAYVCLTRLKQFQYFTDTPDFGAESVRHRGTHALLLLYKTTASAKMRAPSSYFDASLSIGNRSVAGRSWRLSCPPDRSSSDSVNSIR